MISGVLGVKAACWRTLHSTNVDLIKLLFTLLLSIKVAATSPQCPPFHTQPSMRTSVATLLMTGCHAALCWWAALPASLLSCLALAGVCVQPGPAWRGPWEWAVLKWNPSDGDQLRNLPAFCSSCRSAVEAECLLMKVKSVNFREALRYRSKGLIKGGAWWGDRLVGKVSPVVLL